MNKFLQKLGVIKDEFGRANGVLLVNKKIGETSHDVVDKIRKLYGTRKVGHAGTLDPFASGLLIILVGKATKLSDELLGMDKEYEADILFGISTDTSDIEGKISETSDINIEIDKINNALNHFMPEYEQFVPVYSSVKVKGQKLRVLARTHEKFTINKDHVVTFKKQNSEVHINLPSKIVKISKFDIVDFYKISTNELIKRLETYGDYLSAEIIQYLGSKDRELSIANVKINCSKGTYIRQLANDLGEAVNTSTMLVGLKRTQIGPWSISDAVTVEDLEANQ